MVGVKNLKASLKDLKWYEWLMAAIMVVIASISVYNGFTDPNSKNPGWLTIINFISAVCGIFCVFLTAKASISNFIFACVNTIVYIVYLGYWYIWGTFALELFFYLPINYISWFIWAKHRDKKDDHLTRSKKIPWYIDIAVVAGVVIFAIISHAVLVKLNGTVPWLDSFTLAIGIVAVILEMFRYREQYVLWIVSDIIAVAMYIQHFDAVYLTKKSIYLIVAIIGLYNWIKLNKNRNAENE